MCENDGFVEEVTFARRGKVGGQIRLVLVNAVRDFEQQHVLGGFNAGVSLRKTRQSTDRGLLLPAMQRKGHSRGSQIQRSVLEFPNGNSVNSVGMGLRRGWGRWAAHQLTSH